MSFWTVILILYVVNICIDLIEIHFNEGIHSYFREDWKVEDIFLMLVVIILSLPLRLIQLFPKKLIKKILNFTIIKVSESKDK